MPYYDDIQVICAIIGALAILAGFVHYLFKRITHKSKIPKDTEIPVDNKKDYTDSYEIKKETANQNVPRHYNPSTLPEYSEWLNQSVTENRSDELRKALKYLDEMTEEAKGGTESIILKLKYPTWEEIILEI